MKCICTLQFPHSISSFCSCLACIKWKMCQIKLIQFDLTVEILKLYLNSLKWMTHNSMNSAFYDGRSLVSFHSSFFILLDLMNPFFTSVDMCACVRVKSNRMKSGLNGMEIGKCHVILEIRFAFAKSHFFLKLHSNYHLFTSMKKNDKKNQCNHETNKKTTQNAQLWRHFINFIQIKKRDWFLYSIIVLLLHRCRTQSLTMDAHKAHIHLEFMLFFLFNAKANQTKQNKQIREATTQKRKRERKEKNGNKQFTENIVVAFL